MKNNFLKIAYFVFALLFSSSIFAQDTIRTKNVQAVLYLGKGTKQPLIVGLGGSEGGNAWASKQWKSTRDQFIEKGYAFLAVCYFGCRQTPEILDRIAIDEVHDVIMEAVKNKKINENKIAVVGGSRGADLALLLGSHYKDISCVIGLSSSHAVFPGHTQTFTTSCWTINGKELPFIPVNEQAVPFLIARNLRGAFEAMLQDKVAEENALIKVEHINGPVLLLSAHQDEIIPATLMGEKIVSRFKIQQFRHHYEHIVYDGNHAEPTNHFNKIFDFLEKNFKNRNY